MQVVLVDGFGILHPRGCGSASHVGVLADVPTIGVGKNLLHVDGLSEQAVRARMRQGSHSVISAASAAGNAHVLCASADPGIELVGSQCASSKTAAISPGHHPAAEHDAMQTTTSLDVVEGSSASVQQHADGSITMPLVGESGIELGMAVIGNSTVQKPVYVSVGHGISLATAVDIVRQCCLHR